VEKKEEKEGKEVQGNVDLVEQLAERSSIR